MDLYPVYARPLTLQYRARPFSESTVFFLLISITVRYLVPLILVWNSDGFWLKEAQFREMPEIHFKKRFILLLEGINRSTGDYEQYGFTTFAGINHAFRMDHYAPVQIEDYELDFNLDTKLDQLRLKLTVPIDLTQSAIHSLNLILLFDYRLESRIDLRMETVAQFRIQSWAPGKRVRLEGELELVQQLPFFHKGFDYRYNHSLLSDSGEHLHVESEDEEEDPLILENTRPEFQLEQFLEAYYKRDYYTQISSPIRVSHWDPVIAGLANPDPSDIYSFQIDLTLQYQDQLFQYETGFWYLLKWAFIQYFSVWILVNWAIQKLEHIVYEGYMVPTVRLLREQKLLFGLLSQSNYQNDNKKFI